MKIYLPHPASRPSCLSVALKHRGKRGFALIATISVMVLLVMIALAMLSLSTIELRSSQNGRAMAEAQANARMALMIAIGELQRNAGPDTRITAMADGVPLLGFYRSWEGTDRTLSGALKGRPIAPDYNAKNDLVKDGGRFITWGVSGVHTAPLELEDGDLSDYTEYADAASLVSTAAMDDVTVPLLAGGSLPDSDTRQVHVVPTDMGDGGRYAYWMFGENMKARVPKPSSLADGADAGEWILERRSFKSTDPEPFDLEALFDDESISDKIITLNTKRILDDSPTEDNPFFYDLSPYSEGLLINASTGGWKKCMSLFSEKYDEQPDTGLELFRLSPTEALSFNKPVEADGYLTQNSMLYHWADYPDYVTGGLSLRLRGPVASWANMVNYATLYKKVSFNSTTQNYEIDAQYNDGWNNATPDGSGLKIKEYMHGINVIPLVARVRFLISYVAFEKFHWKRGDTPTVGGQRKLFPAILVTPFITTWNPYDVTIKTDRNMAVGELSIPLALGLQISDLPGSDSDDFWALLNHDSGEYVDSEKLLNKKIVGGEYVSGRSNTRQFLKGTNSFSPGETKIFSMEKANGGTGGFPSNQGRNFSFKNTVFQYVSDATRLSPGAIIGEGIIVGLDQLLHTHAGSAYPKPDRERFYQQTAVTLRDNPAALEAFLSAFTLNPSASIEGKAKFDVPNAARNQDFSGFSVEIGTESADIKTLGKIRSFLSVEDAQTMFPEVELTPLERLDEVIYDSGTPLPIVSVIYDAGVSDLMTAKSKGFLERNPFALNGSSSLDNEFLPAGAGGSIYPGTETNHNLAWRMSYFAHEGELDDQLPQSDGISSYIMTGGGATTGFSSYALSELPKSPLTSIIDFTHHNVKGKSPVPPFGLNLVGNSDVHPIISPDDVVNTSSPFKDLRSNEQHDDAYCANFTLADDWFFSSIAPDPQGGRTLQDVYEDFIQGSVALPNSYYGFIASDVASSQTAATEHYNSFVDPVNSWQTIASRLKVKGAFNVNSESVPAWRALLGYARNQKIPYFNADGDTTLSEDTDYAFSRTSIAATLKAGETIDGMFDGASEFSGYRVFTDAMLDQLAENIVEQVKTRGPFLSLSEFINRRLTSSDDDLAIAGALQVALNQLYSSNDADINPVLALQNLSAETSGSLHGREITGYDFPEAGDGHSSYGLPSWPRQADVLKSIAPLLTVRDDTFTIRAYGEATKSDGSVARAWCEAVVQRRRDYVDSSDAADVTTQPTSSINQTFGRRFEIIQFRWLNVNEI